MGRSVSGSFSVSVSFHSVSGSFRSMSGSFNEWVVSFSEWVVSFSEWVVSFSEWVVSFSEWIVSFSKWVNILFAIVITQQTIIRRIIPVCITATPTSDLAKRTLRNEGNLKANVENN